MEAYGVVYRPQPSVAGAGIDDRRSRLAVVGGGRTNGAGSLRIPRPRGRTAAVVRRCGFSDEGYLKYYYNNNNNNSSPDIRCGGGGVVEEEVKKKAMKKRLKLLKGLLSMDQLDNNNNTQQGLLDQIKANLISDATKVLLTQLGQQLRAEEKELKRKKKEAKAIKKQENKKKKNKKMMMLQCDEESSSSSSSSESDCGEVVDMSRLKNQVLAPPPPPPPAVVNELLPEQQQNSPVASQSQLSAGHGLVEELDSRVNVAIIEEQPLLLSSSAVENKKKIEVCMGGKCKKSGAALLIEEFNKLLGGASSTVAVGCKCMGKCKSAPNVRVVLNDDNTSTTQTPPATTKSLCIGVGIDDVSTIVSNFLIQNHNTVDDGFAAAAAM